MKTSWTRVIAHVDMDAFFAAVEQLRNPGLRGKPVIVGADPQGGKGRGVVSTASYEARKFGVHSAMPISRAYRLCPGGIYLKPDGKLYSHYSRRVFEILERFTPLIQVVSVDEAFLDISGSIHLYGSIEALGRAIKDEIKKETRLTASVGIAPSKSVAKIASDYDKPDGLTIVPPDAVQQFLDPLPVTRLWGVGQKTFQALAGLGIQTVQQLREFPADYLNKRFGKMGDHLQRMACGIDQRDVHERDEAKSVSHERTFRTDQDDPEIILSTLLGLSEKVATRLRKYGFRGKTIQIKLRFADFTTFTRHKTIPHHTNMTEEIYNIGKSLLKEFMDHPQPVRLIGIGVSQLVHEGGMQISIWDVENERKAQLERVLDELQERFGRSALTHAQTLTAGKKKKDRKDQ